MREQITGYQFSGSYADADKYIKAFNTTYDAGLNTVEGILTGIYNKYGVDLS